MARARRKMTDVQQRAWHGYIDLSRQLAAGMERQLVGSGVSGADYQVLAPLAEAPERALRPRELSRSTGWERSRLAHQLRRMEARGLVQREECLDDARGTVVRLTEDGLQALRAAAPGHVNWVMEHFLELLTDEELETVADISERVVRRLADD